MFLCSTLCRTVVFELNISHIWLYSALPQEEPKLHFVAALHMLSLYVLWSLGGREVIERLPKACQHSARV